MSPDTCPMTVNGKPCALGNQHHGECSPADTSQPRPDPTYRTLLDGLRAHQYDTTSRGIKPNDPGWHPCSCGWEGYWSDFYPHVAAELARAALAVARPLIAADVQQRIAVALDQRKGDPRYGAALFVQRLDLNLSEAPR